MKTKNILLSVAGLAAAIALTGCKPYNQPEYKEIKSSETCFVIPLEGNSKDQSKLASEDFLEQNKIAAKRILIPKRESDTGRMPWDVEWIPTVRVLTVDRAPITVKWFSEKADQGNGIEVESSDSIGFSTGFSVSAYIKENDAAKFLYNYASGSLESVLNTEVRARVQKVFATVAAKYPIDDLRGRKNEILAEIEKDVTPYFQNRGISITTIGAFGGFTYSNPHIQSAIDSTFIAQQEKAVTRAQLEAQGDRNKKIEIEAVALAEAAKTKSAGEAEGKKLVFMAEADGIRQVNKALDEAKGNPMLLELKKVDVEKIRAEKWNGAYPQWYMPGSQTGMMLSVSPPTVK